MINCTAQKSSDFLKYILWFVIMINHVMYFGPYSYLDYRSKESIL